MIEIGTKLQVSVEGTTTKHEAELVGLRNDEYLIIKMPEKVLYMGHKLVVRYIFKGRIYAFKSDVLTNIFDPDMLIFVKYPKDVQDKNLRAHCRRSCCLPVYVETGVHMLQAIVANLSSKGSLIVIDKETSKIKEGRLKAGDEVNVSLQFPGSEVVHSVGAVLRNVVSEKEVYKLGVEFMELKSKTEDALHNFLQVVSVLEKVESL